MSKWLLPAVALLLANAQPGNCALFGFGDDKSWVEQESKLPAYPKPADLVAFYVSGATSNRFFVDAATLSVDADGVVRYALVIRSASGAENVSFEGLRCKTAERKVYAFGRKDGTWSAARAPEWSPIRYKDVNNHYGMLYAEYFCAADQTVKNRETAIRLLKYPRR